MTGIPHQQIYGGFQADGADLARSSYTAARLQGLERDLHLSPSEYQVGLSVFFVGYVLGPIPSNLLLNYLGRPSSYIGLFGIAWGLVTLLTSQVKSYGSIAACRFVLGVVGKAEPSLLDH